MKLVSFSVSDYRSITTAHRLPLTEMTVLIGPNNEGKSNTLNALATAIELIKLHAEGRARAFSVRAVYDWDRDYPILFQEQYPDGESRFRVEFELTQSEITEFQSEIKSNLNGLLPIEVRVGRAAPTFKVMKKGPGGTALSKKGPQVAEFIGKRFEFRYIPAIRTEDKTINVVSDMLSDAFREIEKDPKYIEALIKIAAIQAPVLEALSDQITAALKQFIPQVKSAEVRISEATRTRALRRSFEIIVDDGIATSIERKGDGIKSLAAISLLKGLKNTTGSSLIALEEPESHLHPGAIHLLKPVIDDLSQHHQIVLTTHCPLFVDRSRVERNILVTNNQARTAKKIGEVREVLGVRASDNLLHANFVLIVEGDTDSRALTALLSHYSKKIKDALRQKILVLDILGGGGNLSYKASSLKAAVCEVHAFLDDDESGRKSLDQAKEDGVITDREYTLTICVGMKSAEIEDTYDPNFYHQLVLDNFNVDIRNRKFRGDRKWSERMEDGFKAHGLAWDKPTSMRLKREISLLVEGNPGSALLQAKREAIDALIDKIERMLPN